MKKKHATKSSAIALTLLEKYGITPDSEFTHGASNIFFFCKSISKKLTNLLIKNGWVMEDLGWTVRFSNENSSDELLFSKQSFRAKLIHHMPTLLGTLLLACLISIWALPSWLAFSAHENNPLIKRRIHVSVHTEAPGMSAYDVALKVVKPILLELKGLKKLEEINSQSQYSSSDIELIFEVGTNGIKAEDLVSKKLSGIKQKLPNSVSIPQIDCYQGERSNGTSSSCM